MVSSAPDSVPSLPLWHDHWQDSLHWSPTAAQTQQFQALYELILAGNRQLNLTRITDPTEFVEKHLWDSLSGIHKSLSQPDAGLAIAPPPALQVIDIGTGAGFPGIPIAIVQPHWLVTLLDSTRKKLAFLDQTLETLRVPNAQTLVGRVEAIGQDRTHRNQYDLALIRAVAGVTVCAEYALPLLKVGGEAVLYRGQWSVAEETALAAAVAHLGGEIAEIEALKTPVTQSDRHCIHLHKIAPTPAEFPRLTGIPSQKPLGLVEDG